jgi:two-component system, OmpR family, sensor kinase
MTTMTMTMTMVTMTATEPAHGVVATVRSALGGIRLRVVTASVVLVALSLALAALVTRQALLARLDDDIEQQLGQEVEELRRLVGGVDPATGEPFGDDVVAIFDTFLARNVPAEGEAFFTMVAGRPYAETFGAPADLLADPSLVAELAGATDPVRRNVSTAAGEARLLSVPLLGPDPSPAGTFVVAAFPTGQQAEVTQAVRTVAVVGVGVVALSMLLAWSFAGRVVRPVRELTTTARRISDTDLSARIPIEGHDELAELGRTFNAMVGRLDAAFAAQRSFLDDVAHELRTPITIVRGHLELLSDTDTDRDETVALVTDELDRMSRYVDELLVLAKSEQPDFLRLELVDAGELAEGLLTRARALASREFTLDAPRPGRVLGAADPQRLTQAVMNLVQNAVQHTAPGDTIHLGVVSEEGHLLLAVRDHGPGIDPADQARLFERHARGAGSRQRRPDGTGLGLAIVSAVAHAHGGTVGVRSQRGDGATFEIRIPFAEEDLP